MTSSTSSSSSPTARAALVALLLWGGAAVAQSPAGAPPGGTAASGATPVEAPGAVPPPPAATAPTDVSTGAITGAVTDAASGRPIVGALVIVTGPALQGEKTEVTGPDGKFRIPGLPPGRYRLASMLAGYQPAERSDLNVKADVTLHADLVAVPEAIQMEEVVIQVPRPPPPPPPPPPDLGKGPKVLVLPPENLSGGAIPTRDLTPALERAAAMAGAAVIGGARLDDYLAKYRIRYTGGVDAAAARAAREELGAEAVLVTTIELWGSGPPRLALTMRLVASSDDVPVVWMDGIARTGDDSPGILALGIVRDFDILLAESLRAMSESMEGYLSGSVKRADPCPGGGWFRPRFAYRARPDQREVSRVAVLPFVNQTRRRGAGEVVALEVARQFAAEDGFRLVEPGTVRDELLRRRIVMEDGVSMDQARTVSATLDADLVVAGYVFDFDDGGTSPKSNFTVLIIDRKTRRVVWQSTSLNKGNDSEGVFGTRLVSTAPRLTCRMAREVVLGLTGERPLPRR